MDLKLSFVEKASQPRSNMSALCESYGISRETGYNAQRYSVRHRRPGKREEPARGGARDAYFLVFLARPSHAGTGR